MQDDFSKCGIGDRDWSFGKILQDEVRIGHCFCICTMKHLTGLAYGKNAYDGLLCKMSMIDDISEVLIYVKIR